MDKQLALNYEREIDSPFTDSLTGLFNHGFFQISLKREVTRSQRYAVPFSLGLINIDSFSFYNNNHGALKGDRILKTIAGVINANIRESDLPARFSGDMFAIIFTKSDADSIFKTTERIRHSVEQLSDVTVSIGLASFPGDATNKEDLIHKARMTLNQAKIRGKNRVYFFETEKEIVDDSRSRILIVDDEPLNLKLLEALLVPLNYEMIKAINGEESLHILTKVEVDLILLDVMMPGMDGFEVCRRIKDNDATRMIPVILVTALDDMQSKIKGIESGADDFITKPPNKMELIARTKSLIKLKKLNNNLTSIENVLFSLANTIEAKDIYTQGHIERVSTRAVELGEKMGLSHRDLDSLRLGGILHDIGKIGVRGDILNKPGPLNTKERKIIRNHPDIGYNICLPLGKNLGNALKVVRHHHEKSDGSGYPDGLKGDEVPLVARIMAVADIYDALITDRPYRQAMKKEEALDTLRQESLEGKIDGEVVGHLIEMVTK